MEERQWIRREWFLIGIFCTGLVGLLCGLLVGYDYGSKVGKEFVTGGATAVSVDTTTDTTSYHTPKAIDSVQTGVIRIKVPISTPLEPTIPKATIKVYNPDSLFVNNTASDLQKRGNFVSKDTAWITIPRTQKRYEDSLYSAWVSGYDPRLDSIKVYRKTIRIVERQTVTKRNAFSLGIVGGAGYGVFSRKPDVFVGIGGSIRLW